MEDLRALHFPCSQPLVKLTPIMPFFFQLLITFLPLFPPPPLFLIVTLETILKILDQLII